MESLPTVQLGVDRVRALVRGLWRLTCAGFLITLLWKWYSAASWLLWWQSERATLIAFAVLLSCLACAAIALLAPAIRWLLLAAWPSGLRIEVNATHVVMELGPFGGGAYDWPRMRIALNEAFDPETVDRMPDDAFFPSLRHPDCDEDLAQRIQLFSGLDSERVTGLLRPYLTRFLDAGAAPDADASGRAR